MWKYTGQQRPPFAEDPKIGQESVWDYPRPPRWVYSSKRIEVFHNEVRIASTRKSIRVLETASPPTFYLPFTDINQSTLVATDQYSYCEWKGIAHYWKITVDTNDSVVAWSYPEPLPGFEEIAGYLAFYPARICCYVDGELVRPQAGQFYGGWITRDLCGPFKGEPGTGHW